MSRGRVFLILGVLAVAAVGTAWLVLRPVKMNVLIVTLDTTRADHLGCYGRAGALTPTLDALAAGGVLFERAYTVAPLTLPAHASLFTGLYPPEHGLRINGQSRLSENIPTLAKILADQGYDTGAFIASFVLDAKFGLNQGFATYGDDLSGAGPADHALHRYRAGNLVVDDALKWLQGHFQQPFLCWVHLYDPHSPYLDHADQFGERFKASPYDGEIAFVDQQVARLRDFLKQRGMDDRTLVVVVGDHGEGLGEHHERRHGKMLYNSTLHVPLIVSLPGKLPAGRRVPDAVSLVDLFPTILETLHQPWPTPISGRSLLAVASGAQLEPRACYGETDEPFHEAGWSPVRSLTTDRWKYIKAPRPELYDLAEDPAELHDLAASDGAELAVLEQRLAEMESRMKPFHDAGVRLSPREQRAMASLGYAAGKNGIVQPLAHQALPDMKDMIEPFNALEDARNLLESGSLDSAVEKLNALVAAAPNYEMAQVILGDALSQAGKFNEAVSQFKKILKHNPESEMAYSHLGDALAAKGHYAEAIQYYQESLKRDPDSDGLQYNLGRALVQSGRVGEAIPHFEAALELDPSFVHAYVELGSAMLREGRPDEAVKHYQSALKYDAQSLQAHANLASVYAGRGQFALAAEHLEHAAMIAPQDANLQYSLGAVLASQGRLKAAAEHLQKSLHLRPDNPPARSLLDQIQGGGRPGLAPSTGP